MSQATTKKTGKATKGGHSGGLCAFDTCVSNILTVGVGTPAGSHPPRLTSYGCGRYGGREVDDAACML